MQDERTWSLYCAYRSGHVWTSQNRCEVPFLLNRESHALEIWPTQTFVQFPHCTSLETLRLSEVVESALRHASVGIRWLVLRCPKYKFFCKEHCLILKIRSTITVIWRWPYFWPTRLNWMKKHKKCSEDQRFALLSWLRVLRKFVFLEVGLSIAYRYDDVGS